ncbi:alpha/beta fold hydrolase [Mycobacterium sp. RTGN3]|uniref:alpha/beta fold hydrolase n=1 Tax=unclassified Mycobacterium TaxID=2642494 RepID=UPI0039AF8517
MLVHGGAAHSGWWDHIAPFFAQTHRVIAPDLSGHGDSGTRTTYHLHTWAREVLAASTAAGPSGRPTIVGHSMGGWITSTAAENYGEQIDSIVVIDSPLRITRQNKRDCATAHSARPDTGRRMRFLPDLRRCRHRRRRLPTSSTISRPSRSEER